jgi:hypothetical protein
MIADPYRPQRPWNCGSGLPIEYDPSDAFDGFQAG